MQCFIFVWMKISILHSYFSPSHFTGSLRTILQWMNSGPCDDKHFQGRENRLIMYNKCSLRGKANLPLILPMKMGLAAIPDELKALSEINSWIENILVSKQALSHTLTTTYSLTPHFPSDSYTVLVQLSVILNVANHNDHDLLWLCTYPWSWCQVYHDLAWCLHPQLASRQPTTVRLSQYLSMVHSIHMFACVFAYFVFLLKDLILSQASGWDPNGLLRVEAGGMYWVYHEIWS